MARIAVKAIANIQVDRDIRVRKQLHAVAAARWVRQRHRTRMKNKKIFSYT